MKHRVAKKKLNRDVGHRKSMLKNLSASLLLKEKVVTTLAKAKYVRPYTEKLITKAISVNKKGDKISKFNLYKELKTEIYSEDAIKKLMNDLSGRYPKASGGYTRIIRTKNRKGDNAQLARIELTAEPVKEKKGKAGKKEKTETQPQKEENKQE